MSFFWMSFGDASLPKGSQFLGGLLIEADDFHAALLKSHRLLLNPGGEVKSFEVQAPISESIEEEYADRLLTREECAEMEKDMMQ